MGLRKESIRKQKEEGDWKDSVRAVTPGPIPAYTYNPSTKEYTEDPITATFPDQDGVTLVPGDSLLLDGQTDQTQNGIVKVVQVGDGALVPWILKRRVDFDTSEKITPGIKIPITEGTLFGGKIFELLGQTQIILDGVPGEMDFDVESDAGGGLVLTTDTKTNGTHTANVGQLVVVDTTVDPAEVRIKAPTGTLQPGARWGVRIIGHADPGNASRIRRTIVDGNGETLAWGTGGTATRVFVADSAVMVFVWRNEVPA